MNDRTDEWWENIPTLGDSTPMNFPDMLDFLASAIDLFDDFVKVYEPGLVSGDDGIQQDVRYMAEVLRAHPKINVQTAWERTIIREGR